MRASSRLAILVCWFSCLAIPSFAHAQTPEHEAVQTANPDCDATALLEAVSDVQHGAVAMFRSTLPARRRPLLRSRPPVIAAFTNAHCVAAAIMFTAPIFNDFGQFLGVTILVFQLDHGALRIVARGEGLEYSPCCQHGELLARDTDGDGTFEIVESIRFTDNDHLPREEPIYRIQNNRLIRIPVPLPTHHP